MNKLDQLFIRACKLENPHKRVFSVYKRFYCRDIKNPEPHIINILAKLCDKYVPMTTTHLLGVLDPNHIQFFIREDYDYNQACLQTLISRIRLSEVSKFPGLTSPARFRREEK